LDTFVTITFIFRWVQRKSLKGNLCVAISIAKYFHDRKSNDDGQAFIMIEEAALWVMLTAKLLRPWCWGQAAMASGVGLILERCLLLVLRRMKQ